MTNLGIMGGSFDPPHWAHLEMADRAMEAIPLDRISFIPAFRPPLNPAGAVASPSHRLKMVELATGQRANWEVLTYEIDQAREVPTIETLEYLRGGDQSANHYLIIGGDQAAQFESWRHWEKILDLAEVVFFDRPHYSATKTLAARAIRLEMNRDISSSEIRAKIKLGESIDGLSPPAVLEYIATEGLYL